MHDSIIDENRFESNWVVWSLIEGLSRIRNVTDRSLTEEYRYGRHVCKPPFAEKGG
jgi:hypothetical protein